MPDVIAILPYFGRLPAYWELTHQTMSRNVDIDWLVITDQQVEPAKNIRVMSSTLPKMRERFEQKLGFSVALSRPYKLCDYRPAFGLLFEEEVRSYAYWGYCDADVVFGDVSKSLAKGLSTMPAKIFQRGHLSFVRNSEDLKYLFREDVKGGLSYRQVFTDERNCYFDEGGGFYQLLAARGHNVFEDNAIFDIEPGRFRLRATTAPRGTPPVYVLRDNRMLELDRASGRVSREARYIHLQKRPYSVSRPEVPSSEEDIVVFGPIGAVAKRELPIDRSLVKLESFASRWKWSKWKVERYLRRIRKVIRAA